MNNFAPALELSGVTRLFGGGAVRAVDDVSLNIHPGEIVSILGPSGCGKTTTMRLIAGLDKPTGGEIKVFGKNVVGQAPHQRNVGLVFQSLAIFPHMSVFRNVAFGLRMKKMATPAIERKVLETLELVQLPGADYAHRMPHELSGGQLQRVALARTLATEPALVLFDEPMAALDRRLRDYMAVELRKIQKALNVAAVYVTHDQETASAMSDRILIMNAGKLIQSGTPEEVYKKPCNRFVAEFLGDINFVKASAIISSPDGLFSAQIADGALRLAGEDHPKNQHTTIAIRPEHIRLSGEKSDRSGLSGEVVDTQFWSGFYRTSVQLSDGQKLQAISAEDAGIKAGNGSRVWITISPDNVRKLSQ